ncbi:AAA family ATPase [Longispora urticae]
MKKFVWGGLAAAVVVATALLVWAVDGPWALLLGVGLPLWLLVAAVVVFAVFAYREGTRQEAGEARDDRLGAALDRRAELVADRLDDLGGLGDVPTRLAPVLDWLRYPVGRLGADVPRALMITGPTGTGKTTLARAVAGEAGVPLFSYTAAEFDELYVGMGTTRMRAVFADARALSGPSRPCVVFVDQFDLLGTGASGSDPSGRGEQERRTMAQFLVELDDLAANGNVFVIAATSRPRALDPALSGARRFGLRIDLGPPDRAAAEEILQTHLTGYRLAADLRVADLAGGVAGFSGAELAQVTQWAARSAADRGTGAPLTLDDFVAARARLLPRVRASGPAEIVEHLDRYVEGQEAAKRRLAVAVGNHYLRLGAATSFTSVPVAVRKSNVLLLGPTGTGKTMLVETVARHLDVPFVLANATTLTETGYAGTTVEHLLFRLLQASDFHLRRAEYGVVCVDEFDKLALTRDDRSRATSAGVQQDLLKLVEGTVVDVPGGGAGRGEYLSFHTGNVLFVGLGAFNGLAARVARRLDLPHRPGAEHPDLLERARAEDLVDHGFLPELVGRFPVVTGTRELTVAELARILRNPRTGLVAEYAALLGLQGWADPVVTPGAVERIAREAARRGVGARGLRAVLEEALHDTMFRRPRSGEGPLVVDADLVDKGLGRGPVAVRAAGPTPGAVAGALAEHAPGSDRAREVLAVASHQHYTSPPLDRAVLLVDPRAHQRGALVRALAATWGVPWAVLDAAPLADTADDGGWATDAVVDLVTRADGHPDRAARGVLLVDNVDRLLATAAGPGAREALRTRIVPLLDRRPLPVADGAGSLFPTEDLFLVLAGDFALPTGPEATGTAETTGADGAAGAVGAVGADGADGDPYGPAHLLDGLRASYSLTPELLRRLLVAVTDRTVGEEQWLAAIRFHGAALAEKYRPLVAHRDPDGGPVAEDTGALARLAVAEGWTPADLPLHLERRLLRRLG